MSNKAKTGATDRALFHVLVGLDPRAKTESLLQRYRAALARGRAERRFANALWLVPSREAVRPVVERLLEGSSSVVFAPRVMTFDGFAESILESLAQDIVPVSPSLQRSLLREVVDRLARSHRLRHFRAIAATTGFLDLVETFIADLKREEIWPEKYLAEMEQGQLAGPRDRELFEIYSEYQSALLRGSLFDNEGRFWSARETLESRGWGLFGQLDLVVVDGFTDFTTTQIELLRDLAARAGEVWISLPFDPDWLPVSSTPGEFPFQTLSETAPPHSAGGSRKELFAIPVLTMQRLAARGTVRVEPLHLEHPLPAVNHVARHLFGDPRATPRSRDAGGIEIHAVAGATAELRTCVVGVKRWLLEGVTPEEVLVISRDATASERLAGLMEDAGVSVSRSTGRPLSELPRVKLLLALLRLEVEDWPFERVVGVLNSSLLQPGWPAWDRDHSPRQVSRFLREEQLPGERSTIVHAAERVLALQPTGDVERDARAKERYGRYQSAARTLLALSQSLDSLSGERTYAEWLETLTPFARELGIACPDAWRASEDTSRREDAESWDLFERTVYALARGARRWLDNDRKFGVAEWLTRLTDLLRRESTLAGTRRGAVRILDPVHARHADARRIWILGLTERSFPGGGGEDCLFSNADREQLHALGLSLRPREQRIREEMLLFWSLPQRASERLVLSYPLTNADGEPLSPSPYLEELVHLFDKTALDVRFDERLDPLPDPEALVSSADLRVHATRLSLEGEGGLFARWASQPSSHRPASAIAAGFDMLTSRFHQRGFGRYEGWAELESLQRQIAERYGANHEFNATELEGYATCPFRFAMTSIAHVRAAASPVPAQDLAARGSLVHDVLAEVHRQLLGERTLHDILSGDTPPADERLVDRFRKLVEERLGRREQRGELEAALLRIEGRLLRDWGDAYQRQWSEYSEARPQGFEVPPVPALFEAAFGESGRGDAPVDPTDVNRYAALIVGAGPDAIRIGGRIDRLDVGRHEGQTVFAVIDYKTGGARKFQRQELEDGRQLQLVLYALAVQRLGLLGTNALPWQFGYWNVRDQGFAAGGGTPARGEKSLPRLDRAVWESLVRVLEEVVPRLASGIRRSEFPVYNKDKECTARCDLAKVCRVAEIRALPDGMAKQWSVAPHSERAGDE